MALLCFTLNVNVVNGSFFRKKGKKFISGMIWLSAKRFVNNFSPSLQETHPTLCRMEGTT